MKPSLIIEYSTAGNQKENMSPVNNFPTLRKCLLSDADQPGPHRAADRKTIEDVLKSIDSRAKSAKNRYIDINNMKEAAFLRS